MVNNVSIGDYVRLSVWLNVKNMTGDYDPSVIASSGGVGFVFGLGSVDSTFLTSASDCLKEKEKWCRAAAVGKVTATTGKGAFFRL